MFRKRGFSVDDDDKNAINSELGLLFVLRNESIKQCLHIPRHLAFLTRVELKSRVELCQEEPDDDARYRNSVL